MADVSIRRNDQVLMVELSCPEKANSLTTDAVESILDAITGKHANDLALVVFSGQGRHFCSGFDISGIDRATDGELLFRMIRVETLLQTVFHAPFVTLALAHGNVVGAGADLVCACAIRVAAPSTTFLMPGLRFGVALGTRRLMHRIGVDHARHWLLESKRLDAQQAKAWGLVNRVADVSEWPEVRLHAQHLASTLPGSSITELLAMGPDTRAEDMAALVNTAGRPGLQRRILDYTCALRQMHATNA